MNSKDCFEVGVRIVGLILIIRSLLYFLTALMVLLSFDSSLNPRLTLDSSEWPTFDYVIFGILSLALGLFLFRKARLVVRWAYGKENPDA